MVLLQRMTTPSLDRAQNRPKRGSMARKGGFSVIATTVVSDDIWDPRRRVLEP